MSRDLLVKYILKNIDIINNEFNHKKKHLLLDKELYSQKDLTNLCNIFWSIADLIKYDAYRDLDYDYIVSDMLVKIIDD